MDESYPDPHDGLKEFPAIARPILIVADLQEVREGGFCCHGSGDRFCSRASAFSVYGAEREHLFPLSGVSVTLMCCLPLRSR